MLEVEAGGLVLRLEVEQDETKTVVVVGVVVCCE